MHGEATDLTFLLVVGILIVGAVATIARRIGVAAPLLLVVLGAGITLIPATPNITVPPEVILTVILPPLLYAAALKVPAVDFRRNIQVIAFLSVVLVVLSAFVVGLVVHALLPAVGFALALALGAVVAPPDAVAATALGKRLGLPPRVVTILEGEGLVNDATALVLLATATGAIASGAVEPGEAVLDFLWAVVGALLVGGVVAGITILVRKRVTERALDAAISIATPFLAFQAAELVHASGIVAVVVAGILVGNQGLSRVKAEFRASERATWETFSLLVENGVFLTMGLQLPLVVGDVMADDPGAMWPVIGVAALVCVVLAAVRFAALPPLLLWLRARARRRERGHVQLRARMDLMNTFADQQPKGTPWQAQVESRLERARRMFARRDNDITALRDQRLGWRDTAVIGWAGIRGVVTVAAAQTLPESELREQLVLIAFIVAVATLLVQGGTLPLLVRVLRLQRDTKGKERTEMHALIRDLTDAGAGAIERVAGEGDYPEDLVKTAITRTRARRRWFDMLADDDADSETSNVTRMFALRHAALDAQRAFLEEARSLGAYSSEAIGRAQELIDRDEIALEADRGVG